MVKGGLTSAEGLEIESSHLSCHFFAGNRYLYKSRCLHVDDRKKGMRRVLKLYILGIYLESRELYIQGELLFQINSINSGDYLDKTLEFIITWDISDISK